MVLSPGRSTTRVWTSTQLLGRPPKCSWWKTGWGWASVDRESTRAYYFISPVRGKTHTLQGDSCSPLQRPHTQAENRSPAQPNPAGEERSTQSWNFSTTAHWVPHHHRSGTIWPCGFPPQPTTICCQRMKEGTVVFKRLMCTGRGPSRRQKR